MAKSLPPDRTLADFQVETDRMFATLEPEDQAWLIAVLEAAGPAHQRVVDLLQDCTRVEDRVEAMWIWP